MSPNFCKQVLWKGFHTYQCSQKATRDGFCGIHHPDAVAKRDAKQKARWEETRRAQDHRYAEERAERQVLLAAEQWGAQESPESLAILREACSQLRAAKTGALPGSLG